MKIIHCADLHLGSPLTDVDVNKRRERRQEIFDTFVRMVEWARNNGVSVIIVAGDLFDSNNVKKSVIMDFFNVVRNYSDIDFIIDFGNHDDEVDFAHAGLHADNLKTSLMSDTFRYGKTVINIAASPDMISTMKLLRNDINIVVSHGVVNRSNFPAGHNIDYCALGHIHSYTEIPIDERGVACYSGCLEPRGFDETGRKGFVLIETDGTKMPKVKHRFVQWAYRTIWEIDVDVEKFHTNWQIYQKILLEFAEKSKNDMAYIKLLGFDNIEGGLDVTYIEKALSGRFYNIRINCNNIKQSQDVNTYKSGRLRIEFEKLVNTLDISDEEKQDILTTGFNALDGEDII